MRWLESQGFHIVERNLTNRAGEIDIVALEDEVLCFVEVKARRSASRFGGAVAAVDRKKQARLERVARLYLQSCAHRGAVRFDVVTLEREDGAGRRPRWRVTLYRGAFECQRP